MDKIFCDLAQRSVDLISKQQPLLRNISSDLYNSEDVASASLQSFPQNLKENIHAIIQLNKEALKGISHVINQFNKCKSAMHDVPTVEAEKHYKTSLARSLSTSSFLDRAQLHTLPHGSMLTHIEESNGRKTITAYQSPQKMQDHQQTTAPTFFIPPTYRVPLPKAQVDLRAHGMDLSQNNQASSPLELAGGISSTNAAMNYQYSFEEIINMQNNTERRSVMDHQIVKHNAVGASQKNAHHNLQRSQSLDHHSPVYQPHGMPVPQLPHLNTDNLAVTSTKKSHHEDQMNGKRLSCQDVRKLFQEFLKSNKIQTEDDWFKFTHFGLDLQDHQITELSCIPNPYTKKYKTLETWFKASNFQSLEDVTKELDRVSNINHWN